MAKGFERSVEVTINCFFSAYVTRKANVTNYIIFVGK